MAKQVHLIGICGSAMASLAGMLQTKGFRVTGSDAAAYPPLSDLDREIIYGKTSSPHRYLRLGDGIARRDATNQGLPRDRLRCGCLPAHVRSRPRNNLWQNKFTSSVFAARRWHRSPGCYKPRASA